MSLVELRQMFFWCSIINLGMLIFVAIVFLAAGNWVCKLHGKIWGIPPEKVRVMLYKVMATYKVLVFVFSVIPWIALKIIS